jgi:hypothetical protein
MPKRRRFRYFPVRAWILTVVQFSSPSPAPHISNIPKSCDPVHWCGRRTSQVNWISGWPRGSSPQSLFDAMLKLRGTHLHFRYYIKESSVGFLGSFCWEQMNWASLRVCLVYGPRIASTFLFTNLSKCSLSYTVIVILHNLPIVLVQIHTCGMIQHEYW